MTASRYFDPNMSQLIFVIYNAWNKVLITPLLINVSPEKSLETFVTVFETYYIAETLSIVMVLTKENCCFAVVGHF